MGLSCFVSTGNPLLEAQRRRNSIKSFTPNTQSIKNPFKKDKPIASDGLKKGIEVLDNLKKNKKVEESPGPILKPSSKVYLKKDFVL